MKQNFKYTLLVVDDEPSNIEVIIESLIDSDLNIFAATSGEMACLLAEKINPDLIILDWQLPGMSGIEVIIELKSQEATKHIPIVMASAIHTSSRNLKMALEAGAFDFVHKPFDKIELEARVNSALSYFEMQQRVQQQCQEIVAQKEVILHDQLEIKKQELISGALQIAKQFESNQNIIKEISKIIPTTDTITGALLTQIVNNYRISEADNYWIEFKARFTQIHHKFYVNLHSSYPELTSNDERLCAFLRLSMTNHEIAAITFQSIESIRKAKFRLRQKFHAKNENQIFEILSHL